MNTTLTRMAGILLAVLLLASTGQADEQLDNRVQAFLDRSAGHWRDMNVPAADGRILHDLIVERGFTRGVEIGTSTGHSTIWIAWALSKTGGKLVTFEIDRRRQDLARENVEAAGLSDYVEFILGDAHEGVPALEDTYDFVFSDADKDWYINYFDAMYPKLTANACFTAHNVTEQSRRRWAREYYEHVSRVADMESYVHPDSQAGVVISCKHP